jgi:hypothetical protein
VPTNQKNASTGALLQAFLAREPRQCLSFAIWQFYSPVITADNHKSCAKLSEK